MAPSAFLSLLPGTTAVSCSSFPLCITKQLHRKWRKVKARHLKLQIKNTRLGKTQLYGCLCNLRPSFLPVWHGRAVNHIITGYFSMEPWPHPVQQDPGCSPSEHPVTISSSWCCWRCGPESCLLRTCHTLLCRQN